MATSSSSGFKSSSPRPAPRPAKTVSKSKPAPKPAKTTTSKTTPAPAPPSKNTSNTGKTLSKTDNTPPPSKNSLFKDSWSTNKEKSHSFSKSTGSDGYSFSSESKNITTEGSTRLVDNLVNAFTGESSSHSINSSSSSSSSSRFSNLGDSNGTNHRFSEENCIKHNTQAAKQFEHLDLARDQLTSAQNKVQEVFDAAVEGRLGQGPEVSAADEKRAEKEQEQITRAEGKLDRAHCQLTMKQEAHRQAKNEFNSQTQAAEEHLLGKYGSVSPELRQELLKKLRPMITGNDSARNNPQSLEEAANWYLKTDSQAQRLLQEGKAEKPGAEKSTAAVKGKKKKLSPSQKESRAKRKKLEKNLREKLNSSAFEDQLKNAKPGERSDIVRREVEPLSAVSGKSARKFEGKLNKKLAATEKKESEAGIVSTLGGKNQEKNKKAVDRLMEAKYKRAGAAGANNDPLKRTVDLLDTESIKQTKRTLENINLEDITSKVDLERSFGRGISEVRADLEAQIARGGKSTTKARKTLTKLDQVIRRSELLSSHDSWGALRQSTGSTGPNLGNFLGLPSDGLSSAAVHRKPGQPLGFQGEKADRKTTGALVRRLRQSGSKADDEMRQRTLERARGFAM